MSKIRIYELARELGLENKQVIACAQRLGLADKSSHSNSLEDNEADLIRRALLRDAMGASALGSSAQSSGSSTGRFTTNSRPVVIQRSAGGDVVLERRQGNIVHRRRNDGVDPAPPVLKEPAPELKTMSSAEVLVAESNPTPEQRFEDFANSESLEALTDPKVEEANQEDSNQPVQWSDGNEQSNTLNHADALELQESVNDSKENQLKEPLENTLDVTRTDEDADLRQDDYKLDDLTERTRDSEHDESAETNNKVDVLPEEEQGSAIKTIETSAKLDQFGNKTFESSFKPTGPKVLGTLQSFKRREVQRPGIQTATPSTQAKAPTSIEDLTKDVEPEDYQIPEQRESRLIRAELPKTAQGVVSEGGPKILGRIVLPTKKAVGKVESRWSDEVLDDDDDLGSRRKSKSRKREISRKDLIDYDGHEGRRGKSGKGGLRGKDFSQDDLQKHEFSGPKASKRVVRIDEFITVGELARQMSLKAGDVITKLIGLGVMATINQTIDKDTATIIAEEFDYQVESIGFDEVGKIAQGVSEIEGVKESRPPVVTVMGHVDHGKTSLLDRIRRTTIADKEHGGITQHIGAYQVVLEGDRKISFLDTPGHAAFTAMRARGAEITDIVVLVVAADDGVMPQTIEAINHSKAANVPIIVAVNKMDKVGVNPDKIKQQLSEHGLQPEEWGGETMFIPVSAMTGQGVDDLLESILLLSEIKELRAVRTGRARGVVIESSQERGLGTVATLLVQEGTLSMGDIFVAGAGFGKVRSLRDERGTRVGDATPSTPVRVTGFDGVPQAGDDFIVVESESIAREIAENRALRLARAERALEAGPISLEEFHRRASTQAAEGLNVILKADVHGSVEAVKHAIQDLSTDKVIVKVLHAAVGGITESDIQLAIASNAIVFGFGVRAEPRAMADAESAGVKVGFYRVIYELVDAVKKAMVGLLAPDTEEVSLGRAEVRDTFVVPKMGTIAGCYISEGIVKRGALLRVVRDSRIVYQGKMSSLRRFKEDVKQVQSGYECGLGVENFNDIKIGDVIEAYELKEIAPTL